MDKSITTLSDSSFYRKIIRKYQKGNMNYIRFPTIIFCKNMGYVLSQKNDINALIQIHFHDQNKVFYSTTKGIRNMKELFRTEELISQFVQKLALLKNLQVVFMTCQSNPGLLSKRYIPPKMASLISFFKSVFPQLSNMILSLNNALQPLYSTTKFEHKSPVFLSLANLLMSNTPLNSVYPQAIYNKPMNNHLLSYGSNMQTRYSDTLKKGNFKFGTAERYLYPPTQQDNTLGYQNLFEYKSPAILSHWLSNRVILYKGKDLFKGTYQNSTFTESTLKNNNYTYGPSTASFTPLYKSALSKDNDNFYFQNNRKVEQKIEQIKKTAEEAKETATKISMHVPETDTKRLVDITRISDQVYQNIERRIRMERERRGI